MVLLNIHQASSKLALLTVTLLSTVSTQDDSYGEDLGPDCLPDTQCRGGLEVSYGRLQVGCDDVVDEDLVVDPPTLEMPMSDDQDDNMAAIADYAEQAGYLLLLMVDADAPSVDSCPDKYLLHWMALVKVEGGLVRIVYPLVEYAPPSPPSGSGKHRYQLLLYDVEDGIPKGSLPRFRSGFDLQKFRMDIGLGDLTASFQFTVDN